MGDLFGYGGVDAKAPMLPILKKATVSGDGVYRYRLERMWGRGPTALFVMLNPSTADASVDDATIRALIRHTMDWKFQGFEVVNLFAYRATDPADLVKAGDAAIGPDNNWHIGQAARFAEIIVCAWGAHPMARGRSLDVMDILLARPRPIYCMGHTKEGKPKHPLYLKTGTELEIFKWRDQ